MSGKREKPGTTVWSRLDHFDQGLLWVGVALIVGGRLGAWPLGGNLRFAVLAIMLVGCAVQVLRLRAAPAERKQRSHRQAGREKA
jgi:hypothetical protein